ncbi:lipopolysaccharide biosynthesis protein [Halobacteriovorax sp. HLS]|uniref:lipopolysaccharide biosynthesis protein n=1 Tax=Halobacteriovorax sp. HLS TaxID=2234000 RepID=UPI000FD9C3CE|nr:oligosaccharide flippase family protein [Halobacteriovorax sp. HLS]
MKDKLVNNILYSFLEKLFQILSGFVSSFFIIRMLERESYGVIGIVAGFYALVNIFNFSYEAIIVRDHKKFDDDELGHFLAFSLYKMIVLFFLSLVLAIGLSFQHSNFEFYYAVGSIFAVFSLDFLSAPIVLLATSRFRHDLVSKVSFLRYVLNVVLLGGLFYYPNLKYLFIKDIFVLFVVSVAWIIVLKKSLKVKTALVRQFIKFDTIKFYKNISDYSLWTHLIACVTYFIYRADTIFLSFISPLRTIGNYNVALSCGNFANIAPAILGFQNSVAISNVEDHLEIERVSSSFTRISIIASALMLAGLFFTGEFLLEIVTGQNDVSEIFFYTKCIVIGLLLVKSLASPMVSVIQMKGNVKELFLKVNIPVFFITVITYSLSSIFYGARGVAIANIINSLVWIVLLYFEFNKMGFKLVLTSGYGDDLKKLCDVIRRKFC